MMAEALGRWLREEMELPPSAAPSPAALRRLCSGPTAPVWDYVTRHVRNQRNVKKIRGNLRWYGHLQELEAAAGPPSQQGAQRASAARLRKELQGLGDAIADAQETAQRLEASLEEGQSRRWAELQRGAELRLLGAGLSPAGLRDGHQGALKAFPPRPGQSQAELSAILASGVEPEVLVSIKALCRAREAELQRPRPHRAANHSEKAQQEPDWLEQAEAVLIGHSPGAVLWALEALANQSTRALLAGPAPSAEAPPTLRSLLQERWGAVGGVWGALPPLLSHLSHLRGRLGTHLERGRGTDGAARLFLLRAGLAAFRGSLRRALRRLRPQNRPNSPQKSPRAPREPQSPAPKPQRPQNSAPKSPDLAPKSPDLTPKLALKTENSAPKPQNPQNSAPESSDLAPKSALKPQNSAPKPQNSASKPQNPQNSAPKSPDLAPKSSDLAPKSALKPQNSASKPQNSAPQPQNPQNSAPKSPDLAPKLALNPENSAPKSPNSAPKSPNLATKFENSAPKPQNPQNSAPKSSDLAPKWALKPENSAPKSPNSAPKSPNLAPKFENSAPKPQNPQNSAPKSPDLAPKTALKTQNSAPKSPNSAPKSPDSAPKSALKPENSAPKSPNSAPKSPNFENSAPKPQNPQNSAPKSPDLAPKSALKAQNSAPKSPNSAPKSPNFAPKSPNSAPKSPNSAPKSPNSAPKSPNSAPKSPNFAPKSPNSAPKSPNSAPKSPNLAPKSPNFAPKSPNFAPKSPNLAPKSPNLAPKSRSWAPNPADFAPNPADFAPNSALERLRRRLQRGRGRAVQLQQRLRFLSAASRGRRAALRPLQEQVVGVARAGPGSASPLLEGAWLRHRQLALGALEEPRPPPQATPPLQGLAREMGVAQGALLSRAAILRQELRQGALRLRQGAGPALGAGPEPAAPPLHEGVAELLPQLRLVSDGCRQRIRDWPRLRELVSEWWAQPAQWALATPSGHAPFAHWLQRWRAAAHTLQATPTPEEAPPTAGQGEERGEEAPPL